MTRIKVILWCCDHSSDNRFPIWGGGALRISICKMLDGIYKAEVSQLSLPFILYKGSVLLLGRIIKIQCRIFLAVIGERPRCEFIKFI